MEQEDDSLKEINSKHVFHVFNFAVHNKNLVTQNERAMAYICHKVWGSSKPSWYGLDLLEGFLVFIIIHNGAKKQNLIASW